MANELTLDHPALSGSTLYALLINAVGQVWDGVDLAFEAFIDAQIGQYDLPLTEQGTTSGFFAGDMPAAAAGTYWYSVRRQAGGSPAITDAVVGSGEVRGWTGTAWVDESAGGGASAADVADAVWDEARSEHVAAGSFGQGIASVQGNLTGSVGSVTAGVTLAASAVQAIWDVLTSALTTVGSIGKRLVDNLDVVLSSRMPTTHIDATAGTVDQVTLVDTVTTNTDMRGTDQAALASVATEARLAALDAANMPADLTAILTDTDALQIDWADGGRLDLLLDQILADTGTDGVALSSTTMQSIATTLLDLANGIEISYTLKQALRLILAACAGKADGLEGTTVHYRDPADATNRITATVDASGNRTAITLDVS